MFHVREKISESITKEYWLNWQLNNCLIKEYHQTLVIIRVRITITHIAQKINFSIDNFSSKFDQIHRKLHVYWSNPSWKTSFFVQWLIWCNLYKCCSGKYFEYLGELVEGTEPQIWYVPLFIKLEFVLKWDSEIFYRRYSAKKAFLNSCKAMTFPK